MGYLEEKAADPGRRDAKNGGKLAGGDKQGHACAEGRHDGVGNIVGDVAKAQDAHKDLKQAAEQGNAENDTHARGFGQLQQGDARHGDRPENGEEHKGGPVGWPGGEEAGRSPEGGHNDGRHAGVNAVLRRDARHGGIGHGQRHGHGRQGKGGQKIPPEVTEAVAGKLVRKGEKTCEHGYPGESVGRFRVVPRFGHTAAVRRDQRWREGASCGLPSSSSRTSCPRA